FAPECGQTFGVALAVDRLHEQALVAGPVVESLPERGDRSFRILPRREAVEVIAVQIHERIIRQTEIGSVHPCRRFELDRLGHPQHRFASASRNGTPHEFRRYPHLVDKVETVAPFARKLLQFPYPEADVVASSEGLPPQHAACDRHLVRIDEEHVGGIAQRFGKMPLHRAILLATTCPDIEVEDQERMPRLAQRTRVGAHVLRNSELPACIAQKVDAGTDGRQGSVPDAGFLLLYRDERHGWHWNAGCSVEAPPECQTPFEWNARIQP